MRRRDERGALRVSWAVWIFPVIAVLIAGKVFYDFYRQRGPTVEVLFDDATGIQAEKTSVRFRGVTIGKVMRVTISKDHEDVIAHVLLQRDAKQFASKGSKYTLIVPKVGIQGVQGLETIFEGSYIAALPGAGSDEAGEGNEPPRFRGQVGRETNDSLEDTISYTLEAGNAESISVGDPVLYRGLKIGTVTKVSLSKTARSVLARINVQSGYSRVIRENTFFWKKSAVHAKLGLFSSEIRVSSLDSLINSGIELATPDEAGPIAKGGTKFPLWAAPPKHWDRWSPRLEFGGRTDRQSKTSSPPSSVAGRQIPFDNP